MRLDKRKPGLAFGSPASRRCAAGTRRKFNYVIFESTVLSVLLFFVPPLMGGILLATSEKTKDRYFFNHLYRIYNMTDRFINTYLVI